MQSDILKFANMAPSAIQETSVYDKVDTTDLKAKVDHHDVELEVSPKPPVADDFMYDFKYNHPLPTTDVLGVEIPVDCDAQREAEGIVSRLSEAMGKGNAQAFTDMFLDHGTCKLLGSCSLVNLLGSPG